MDSQADRTIQHTVLAKSFHWGVALLYAYGIIKQIDDVAQLNELGLLKFEVVFALLLLIILGARFLYMRTQPSALPPSSSPMHVRGAKIVHYGMYIAIASIALSGLLIGCLVYLGFDHSGFAMAIAIQLHDMSVSASYWLIGLHILAAFYHRVMKTGVWDSMVPIFKEQVRNKEV